MSTAHFPATAVPGDALVEREDQLAAMSRWAGEAAVGAGRLVLISGEAGIGKSALVAHFRAGVPDAEWLQGACDSLFTPRPLGPHFDMAPAIGDAFLRLLREGTDRQAIASEFLARITEPGCLRVVVVEDIHWADEATLDLLRHVGRRIQRSSTLVVATFRDEPAEGSDKLAVVLGDLARQPSTRRIHLEGLSTEGVAQLCGQDGPDPNEMHRLTGGNPFFLAEILGTGGAQTPRSVQDAVSARLVGISRSTCELVELAALYGLGVQLSVLGPASSLEAEASAVDELVVRGLFVEDEAGLRFRHEIVRLAIGRGIPPRRRTLLHRRILGALVGAGCDDDARLAFHADGADDEEATLVHSHRAARTASRAGSMREAAAHFRRALEVIPAGALRTRAELQDGLADALGALKDYQASIELRERAISTWELLGSTENLADSLLRGVWVLNATFRVEDALSRGRRAVELMEPHGPSPELVRAHIELARVLMVHDRLEESLRHTRKARPMAEKLGLDKELAGVLNTEACCLGRSGRPWDVTMKRSLALAQRVGDATSTVRVLHNTHVMLLDDLRLVEAFESFAAAFDRAREHDLDTFWYGLVNNQARLLERLGRWDEAVALATEFAAQPGGDEARSMTATVVSLITARRGDRPQEKLLDDALHLAEKGEQPQYLVPARLGRAEIAWLAGVGESARKEVGLARDAGAVSVHLVRDIELWAHRVGMGADVAGLTGPAALEVAGRAVAAARAWDEASCPYDAALALLGSPDRAHLSEAVGRFDALGAVAAARMARRRMRELGFRSVPPEARASTRTHPKGLTVREREVLELVAAGLRNRDIAERLFVSQKTVATHVSSVMRKLGVLSRVEAAAWLHEHDSDRLT